MLNWRYKLHFGCINGGCNVFFTASSPGLLLVWSPGHRQIQKAPQLLDVVHSLLEEQPEHGAANLLGGRLALLLIFKGRSRSA